MGPPSGKFDSPVEPFDMARGLRLWLYITSRFQAVADLPPQLERLLARLGSAGVCRQTELQCTNCTRFRGEGSIRGSSSTLLLFEY